MDHHPGNYPCSTSSAGCFSHDKRSLWNATCNAPHCAIRLCSLGAQGVQLLVLLASTNKIAARMNDNCRVISQVIFAIMSAAASLQHYKSMAR
eukprot:388621-Amphidinium_carterae.1